MLYKNQHPYALKNTTQLVLTNENKLENCINTAKRITRLLSSEDITFIREKLPILRLGMQNFILTLYINRRGSFEDCVTEVAQYINHNQIDANQFHFLVNLLTLGPSLPQEHVNFILMLHRRQGEAYTPEQYMNKTKTFISDHGLSTGEIRFITDQLRLYANQNDRISSHSIGHILHSELKILRAHQTKATSKVVEECCDVDSQDLSTKILSFLFYPPKSQSHREPNINNLTQPSLTRWI